MSYFVDCRVSRFCSFLSFPPFLLPSPQRGAYLLYNPGIISESFTLQWNPKESLQHDFRIENKKIGKIPKIDLFWYMRALSFKCTDACHSYLMMMPIAVNVILRLAKGAKNSENCTKLLFWASSFHRRGWKVHFNRYWDRYTRY